MYSLTPPAPNTRYESSHAVQHAEHCLNRWCTPPQLPTPLQAALDVVTRWAKATAPGAPSPHIASLPCLPAFLTSHSSQPGVAELYSVCVDAVSGYASWLLRLLRVCVSVKGGKTRLQPVFKSPGFRALKSLMAALSAKPTLDRGEALLLDTVLSCMWLLSRFAAFSVRLRLRVYQAAFFAFPHLLACGAQ